MQYPIPEVCVQYSKQLGGWMCYLAYREGPGHHRFQGPTYNSVEYLVEWLRRLFPTAPIKVKGAW